MSRPHRKRLIGWNPTLQERSLGPSRNTSGSIPQGLQGYLKTV